MFRYSMLGLLVVFLYQPVAAQDDNWQNTRVHTTNLHPLLTTQSSFIGQDSATNITQTAPDNTNPGWINKALARNSTGWITPRIQPFEQRQDWVASYTVFTDQHGTYTIHTRGLKDGKEVGPSIHLIVGPKATFTAWNGFARAGDWIYIYGGGHGDYAGNTVSRWNMRNDIFERVFDPRRLVYQGTQKVGNNTEEIWQADDGSAPVPHVYSAAQYVPSLDAIFYKSGGHWAGYTDPDGRRRTSSADRSKWDGVLKRFDISKIEGPGRGNAAWWAVTAIRENINITNGMVVLLPDGNIGTLAGNRQFRVFDPTTEKLLDNGVSGGAWTGLGTTIYSGSENALYFFWASDLYRMPLNETYRSETPSEKVVDYPDGRKSYSGLVEYDGKIWIFSRAGEIETYDHESGTLQQIEKPGAYPGIPSYILNKVWVENGVFVMLARADLPPLIYKPGKKDTIPAPDPIPEPNPEPIPDPEPNPDPVPLPDTDIPFGDVAALQDMNLIPRIWDVGGRTPKFIMKPALHGGAGERSSIGLITEEQAYFLATGRGREYVIGQADWVLENLDYKNPKFMLDPKGGGWGSSHHPNLFWLPFLLTGDLKYVDGLESFWANYSQWGNFGRKITGVRPFVTRSDAWNLRNLFQLAWLEKRGLTKEKFYVAALENSRQYYIYPQFDHYNYLNDNTRKETLIQELARKTGRETIAPEEAWELAQTVKLSRPIAEVSGLFHRPERRFEEFRLISYDVNVSGGESWTGWMESFYGIALNHGILLGFEEWRSFAEWNAEHILRRSGDRWPLKAVDAGTAYYRRHPDYPDVDWEKAAPYKPEDMAGRYADVPDNELISVHAKRPGGGHYTFANRAHYAYVWLAAAANAGVLTERTKARALEMKAAINRRGDQWEYKTAWVLE